MPRNRNGRTPDDGRRLALSSMVNSDALAFSVTAVPFRRVIRLGLQDYFHLIAERLQTSATVKTIYGEPIVAEGKTVIPVGRVAYAFCTCSRPEKKNEAKQQMEVGIAGGCGGGAVAASPLGVVEITKEDTRFIPIDEKTRLAGALLVGFFLGLLVVSRRSRR